MFQQGTQSPREKVQDFDGFDTGLPKKISTVGMGCDWKLGGENTGCNWGIQSFYTWAAKRPGF